jgi:hypothetical protein
MPLTREIPSPRDLGPPKPHVHRTPLLGRAPAIREWRRRRPDRVRRCGPIFAVREAVARKVDAVAEALGSTGSPELPIDVLDG